MAKDAPVLINKTPEVSRLEVEDDFAKLTLREKFYAHYLAR
jgi:dipeptidyl-peptidase III